MNQIKAFDLSRVGLLIKKEIFYQRRAPWIIVAGVFVFLLIFNLLMAEDSDQVNDLPGNQVIFYVLTLLTLGTVFTSASFNELNNKSSAHHYLSIPASSLEKLISKWLITGIFYVVAFNIFYIIFWLFSDVVTGSLFGIKGGVFNPFESRIEMDLYSPWFFSKLYLALHTIYLAGAVYFRKFSYFKTAVAQGFIFFTLLGLIAGIGSLFFYDIWAEGMHVNGNKIGPMIGESGGAFLMGLGKIMLWVVFPLWMLTYSYFKLKETEV